MKARIKWVSDAAFVGETAGGHTVMMDGPSEGGGKNLGPRPMEMLILGMGACSAYDVVSILKKARQNVVACELSITAQRATGDPKVFTDIQVHFLISGHRIKEKQVNRAICLSKEKYCSASIMLGATANITHEFDIIEIDD